MRRTHRFFYQDCNQNLNPGFYRYLLRGLGRSLFVVSLLWGSIEISATRLAIADPAIAQTEETGVPPEETSAPAEETGVPPEETSTPPEETNEETSRELLSVPQIEAALVGRWEGSSNSGKKLVFEFTENGKLFVRFPSRFRNRPGSSLEFRYTINADRPIDADRPIPLDIGGVTVEGIEATTVLTIFEFTNQNWSQMILQLHDTNPGQPRPSQFENATLLQKALEDESETPATFQPIDTLPKASAAGAR